ncbi:uncharacterized protein LOC134198416 isoform X2 [Corticium candelabrum]|uniref:uncharacterized protein LOC134198416 isoform X2 n=1 Tax=Corticium candelabrum TaxID=121492 RepID=UPI002E2543BA|nr:uncharacterized protein LOC134198416 isoform X2 [Corticium candelabrum]
MAATYDPEIDPWTTIRLNFTYCSEKLVLNHDLLRLLLQHGFICKGDYEELLMPTILSSKRKDRLLLDILPTRPADKFPEFVEILRRVGLTDLANKLEGRSPSRNPASQYDEQLHARLAELERKVQDQERTIQAQGSIMLSSSRHEALSSTHHEVASNVVNTEHQEQGEIPVFGLNGRQGASSLSPQHQSTTSTGQLDSHFPQIPSPSLYQQTERVGLPTVVECDGAHPITHESSRTNDLNIDVNVDEWVEAERNEYYDLGSQAYNLSSGREWSARYGDTKVHSIPESDQLSSVPDF